MEKVTIEITKEVVEQGLHNAIKSIFESSYSNPFKDIIEQELKKQDGAFRTMFANLMTEILTSPEMKTKLADATMTSLVGKLIKQ